MTIEAFKNKLSADKALKAEMLEAIKAGKEEEFLAAQGVEAGKQELSDEELEGAAGGETDEGYVEKKSVYKKDSRGNPTHWLVTYESGKQMILYYTCPKCGRLLHRGTLGFLFCDPCDEWYTNREFSSAVEHIEPFHG